MAHDRNTLSSRRDEILERATELFVASGYAATSMSKVAEAVGVQKASIYHHFPSKEALFVACVSRGYQDYTAALRDIRDSALPATEKLSRALDVVYAALTESQAGRMSPTLAETARLIPSMGKTFHDTFIEEMHEAMAGILAAGMESGEFARLDCLGLEYLIFSPAVDLSLQRQMFASFEDLEERYPVDKVKASHLALLLRLLSPAA
ncbi:TetR/AcrR family transcriptional regulator [Pontivivens ytuae]|uniref:TetR/AcrR family transcriptional regulator n=1 Tax=Pontivivens ytuae TaxID=2789856 RepID=A0A7S9QE67_9RHOB|nr:TetR/AcrR family transcriptional regulator [Pontivivens ytuae]QPH54876.1 TetR/AcrR family transcriptional regulator [Pontivivens ytuae]